MTELEEQLVEQLHAMKEILPDGYKLTLVGRYLDDVSASFVITADDPDEIIATIRHLQEHGSDGEGANRS